MGRNLSTPKYNTRIRVKVSHLQFTCNSSAPISQISPVNLKPVYSECFILT